MNNYTCTFRSTLQAGSLALDLSCPICLQLFSDPVSLPCGHVYCSACLGKYTDTARRCCCPECQAEYQGHRDLLKNFKMCSIIQSYKATAAGSGSSAAHGDPGLRDAPVVPVVCQTNEPVDVDGEETTIMDQSKLLLGSQVSGLTARLQLVDERLRLEQQQEAEVRTENALLRGNAARLLEQMTELMIKYVTGITELIEAEQRPGEESRSRRVSQTSEVREELREAQLQAQSLLAEDDSGIFNQKLRQVQPCINELMARLPVDQLDEDTGPESEVNFGHACVELERRSTELREGLGRAQRSLRNVLNPSEVTFDVDTAHPSLVLSEDLKTVTFSPKKQPYPALPTRFSTFLQVLSTQSFFGGEHRWEVDLDGFSPWIIGVCYGDSLTRSGLASALESSRASWCLMWFDNQLRSFEQGQDVPLKRTPAVRRLEITLSFRSQRLSFYNISKCSGKTHVYTFKANLTEPVHLAYRMMSGQPKARITVYS
ncbi:hypothetical protein DPEC_G00196580 [Dallia pectoralis]|uniref:Uncharacterized protein n=1 Tax=Dallia pectoralis TaxID=75939 RepID=A0ACC2G7V8_DALPE|nr:hypothetical protein DPEC_G00196580 [Dallia pectoralis]